MMNDLSLISKENKRPYFNVSKELLHDFNKTLEENNHHSYLVIRRLVLYFINDKEGVININRVVKTGMHSLTFRIRIPVWEGFKKKCETLFIRTSNTLRFLICDYIEGCKNNDPFFINLGREE